MSKIRKQIFRIPLNQQNLDSKIVAEILKEKFGLESVTTSNNTGLLMNCPKCQQVNKLFYSFGGKMFICMNYKGCGLRCMNFLKLKKAHTKPA